MRNIALALSAIAGIARELSIRTLQYIQFSEPLIYIFMEKKRYTDEELEEFRQIVQEKLDNAVSIYNSMMEQLQKSNQNDDSDTAPTYKVLEEGLATQSKEELIQFAQRQQKFIQGLKGALLRIQNKTYGIDRLTGELIPKERLRIVPHATLSVESKNARKNRNT